VLFRKLAREASKRRLNSVAIILDPPPASVLYGYVERMRIHDIAFRISVQRSCGIAGQLVVGLNRDECTKGAEYFLSKMRQHIHLAEVWLGANQGLGPDDRGGPKAVADCCRRKGIELKRLSDVTIRATQAKSRILLRRGATVAATGRMAFPPVIRRPRHNGCAVQWHPGLYEFLSISGRSAPITSRCHARVVARGPWAQSLQWPRNNPNWLVAIRGPQDARRLAATLIHGAVERIVLRRASDRRPR
jgi:hypothetical protein